MVRNMNAEPRLPRISRRGLLCGAVGASAALIGGELLASDGSDENQPKPPAETDGPGLELDRAYEIYSAVYDTFLRCIREVPTTPVFTGREPLALPPPASVLRTGGKGYGFMTGEAVVKNGESSFHMESVIVSAPDDDLRVEAGVRLLLQTGQPSLTVAEMNATWTVARVAMRTDKDFLEYIGRYDPDVIALSFVPELERPPHVSHGSEQNYERYTLAPGVEGFTISHRGGYGLRWLSPTDETLSGVSGVFGGIQNEFHEAGFL